MTPLAAATEMHEQGIIFSFLSNESFVKGSRKPAENRVL
jgi:hypothetical protein